jgi:hypothetical protein
MIDYSLQFHPQAFHLLPCCTLQWAECENPACGQEHFMITVGWILFTFDLIFTSPFEPDFR